jgi:BON domain
MKRRLPVYVAGTLMSSLLGLTLGCSQLQHSSTASNDAASGDPQITNAIQSKLYANPAIQTKQITVQTANGVVTLAGSAATEAERTAASAEAATIPGVKTVINNITVTPAQTAAVAEPVAPPAPLAVKPRPSKPAARRNYPRSSERPERVAPAEIAQAAPMATVAPVAAAPAVPPPPPAPVKVTVQPGTTLAVRLVDNIDSETAQPGETFRATLDSPLAVDGEVVIPEGYDVQGHVVDVKSAGKFEGRSLLALQLDRIQVGSKYYTISTNKYQREGASRTKNTVEKVGAGSVIGAIIGGIAGGGKGAGIGAAAGGGLGGGVQAATKGQQVKLPSETVLTFELQAPLTVTPTTQGRNSGRPKLDTPPQDNPTNAPSSPPANPPQK